jgi:hypothetical protein
MINSKPTISARRIAGVSDRRSKPIGHAGWRASRATSRIPDPPSAAATAARCLQSRTTREEGGGGKGGRDGGNHQGFPLWEMRVRRTERFKLGRTWYGRLIDRNCPASLGGDKR